MTTVALGSVGGSAGATALALALAQAWGGPCVLVEADPDGGRLAARLELAARPGVADLAAAARRGGRPEPALWRFAQRDRSGVAVLPCHPAAEQVCALLRAAAEPLAAWCTACVDHDVVVDVGRWRPGSPSLPLARAADRRLAVVRGEPEDIVALVHRAELLQALGGVDVVVMAGTYGRREVAQVVPWPVAAEVPARATRRAARRIVHELANDLSPSRSRAAEALAAAEPPDGIEAVAG